VNAGGANTVCQSATPSAITLSGATIGGGATTGAWSIVSGGGTLSSTAQTATPQNITYTPAANYSGAVTLRLTTNAPGACAAVSSDRTITVTELPTVNAGGANTVCQSATPSAITLSGATIGGGATTGAWSIVSGGGTLSSIAQTATPQNVTYTPAANYSGAVTLRLTTNAPVSCANISADLTITVKEAVQITTQPQNVGVCVTNPASLSVVGYGDNLTYQWYKGASPGTAVTNSANISGATSTTLNFNQANISDGGTYYVVVSGDTSCSSVKSNEVTLNVNQVMNFTSQPISQTLCEGSNATFSITATGAISSYQWRKNGMNISGANSASYTINNITTANNGNYDIVLTGIGGTCPNAYSTVATLTVTPTVTINAFSPATSTRCQGAGTVTTTTTANNSTGITYSLDAASIAGGNTIVAATGAVNYAAGWSGTTTITASAAGCNGPATITHIVTVTPTVTINAFSPATSTRCQGAGTVTTTTTANNSTGITYSLDAASIAGGNTIDSTTGAVTYAAGWSGTTTITASAAGCNGPATTTHVVTVTPTVTINAFSPSTSTLCQGAGTVTTTTTANNSTGITYSLDAASIAGGNNIDSTTGAVTYSAGWSGTTTITASAAGCNGPATTTLTVTIDPASIGGIINIQGTTNKTILVCHQADAASSPPLILSGFTGNIVEWEYSINAGTSWVSIANTTNVQSYVGITETRIYRAVIKSGSCAEVKSAVAIVSVTPNIKPQNVSVSPTPSCLGIPVNLSSESGFTTSGLFTTGGTFNNASLPGWTADNDPNINTGGSSTDPAPFRLSATNGGTYSGVFYRSDNKFAIVHGAFTSKLETPIFSTIGWDTATLKFDHAYNLLLGATAKIEISINGGTYILLEQYTGTLSPNANSFPSRTIDLSPYLGQTNLRIRFSYVGTVGSSWAIDNVGLPDAPLGYTMYWTDEDGTVISTTNSAFITPASPGVHSYMVTSLINGCQSFGTEGSVEVEIRVNYAFAGNDVAIAPDDCGNNTVKLNAYDNTRSADYNLAKGAFDKDNKYDPDNDAGTGATGIWTIKSGPSTCSSGTFYPNNTDPDATFTGDAGTYVLTWTAGGCTDDVQITLTDCSQINFDGVNDNITFKNNYNLTNPFSIEVWVKPNSVTGMQTILSKRDGNNLTANNGYDLRQTGNIISFNWNNGGTIVSPHAISENRWYHIAVTFGSGIYTMYIDGIEVVKSVNGQSAPGTNNLDCILGAMDQTSSPPNKPVNYFSGWMDELRIWNVALTPDQLHQMMNQEIEANGALVRGKIVPIDVNPLSWTTNLLGYYQMSDISCGYLNPTAGTVTGKLRNITSPQLQTAPIPYTSSSDGNWNTMSTWTQPIVWNAPNSKGIDGTTDIDWNIVRTGHNVISNTQDITLLGLLVDANKVTITGAGAQDENNSGHGLWITHYLKLDGQIDLVGESQLVQKRYGTYDGLGNFSTTQFSESIFEPTSSGYIERDQQGKKNSYNYNYWSSPVTLQGAANNAPYKLPDVLRDGTYSANPRTIDFVDGAYSADTPNGLNPIKITSRWIWTYRATIGTDPWANYYQWVNVGYWGQIKVGDGYTMKGTGGSAGVTAMQNYVFVGKPNSGDITTTQLNLNQTYLIGNPYPSALDANEFIKNNLKDCTGCTGSANVFNGALYFWDHFELSNNHLLAEYEGGYATLNLTGGVVAISNVPLTASTNNSGSKIPERYIPVGQGFFVESTLPILSGTGTTLAPGNLYFKNSQRVFQRESVTGANNGSVFMKTAVSKKSANVETTVDSRPKIRLTFDSPLGYRRPLLVGVDENTSNQFDFGYDAPLNEENKEDMFWQLGKGKLVIQGVNNFDEDQELPLGLKISKTGLATIKIEEVKYIDENVTLHIKDKFTGKAHNISYKPFEIELEPGTYLDRFALIFKYQKLVAEDLGTDILLVEPVVEDHNYHVFMNNASAELQIKNNGTDEIRRIIVYNNIGQVMNIWNKDLNRRIISLPVKLATGVYVVQINTINGASINKRIIIE
ncbi:MAG: LamG-like jellyroll fold domain-containing protein, partial [Lutibacter sp.]|nr:LamG-like jellyroll fold domain-containing protein [Lutibacter sp.]